MRENLLQVDLGAELYAKLRKRSFDSHEAMSVIVRSAVAHWLALVAAPEENSGRDDK